MSIYKNNRYDVTVECRVCHDLYDGQIQLKNHREVDLVKELLAGIFYPFCHKCGAESKNFHITVSNEYYTADEVKKIMEEKSKKLNSKSQNE